VTPIATDAAPAVRRHERWASVTSTNDVVRGWLAAGEPEICVAFADEQTAGRGRNGRSWAAPPGCGLLVSLGFRPTWLSPDRVWRLAASVSLAMADAAENVTRLPTGSIGLKWPNDLVITPDGATVRKLGGVLGETDGLGTDDPRAVVGIGLNADWPEASFPADLRPTMTSLRVAAGDRRIDVEALSVAFLAGLEARIEALHGDRFDAAEWADRQATTGRTIELALPDGSTESLHATGVDGATGALRVRDGRADGPERSIVVGEVVHVRLAAPVHGGL
jgi:BirA family biotin operon repressor/biotin-[acetyl-CoA-carboxylase] ligase